MVCRPSGGEQQQDLDIAPQSIPKVQTVPTFQPLAPSQKSDPSSSDLLGGLLIGTPSSSTPAQAINQEAIPTLLPAFPAQPHAFEQAKPPNAYTSADFGTPMLNPSWQLGSSASAGHGMGAAFPTGQQVPYAQSHQLMHQYGMTSMQPQPSLLDTSDSLGVSGSGILAPAVKPTSNASTVSSQSSVVSVDLIIFSDLMYKLKFVEGVLFHRNF